MATLCVAVRPIFLPNKPAINAPASGNRVNVSAIEMRGLSTFIILLKHRDFGLQWYDAYDTSPLKLTNQSQLQQPLPLIQKKTNAWPM